ncbi:hypothetical protein T4D_11977 [Trichinella pseudospiralis]|uniref:Uncharacterized protein n=1 Tax=Trichinella pseudospiralis TaxID=6337 RepID=A0A0V1F5H6_TRIPS|nr:hypothetical protein T4D_11977 [Trichinella pseudospiralis]
MSVSDEYGRHQQSGTTTSGNLVGAAIRPRNLGANLKAKIQEGRNGVTSSNYRKQLLFQLTTRDCFQANDTAPNQIHMEIAM